MENIFGPGEEFVVGSEIENIACLHHEFRVALSMGEVLEPPADEIVDHVDAKTLVEQPIDHVAADKTGSSGDDGEFATDSFRAPILFQTEGFDSFHIDERLILQCVAREIFAP